MTKNELLVALGKIDQKYISKAFEQTAAQNEDENRETEERVGIMDEKKYIRKKIEPIIAVAASVVLCVGVLIFITMRNDKDKLTENSNNVSSSVSESTAESESTTDPTEIENAYQDGYNTGYAEGRVLGYDEGFSAAIDEVNNEDNSYEEPVDIRVSGEFTVTVHDFVPFYGNNPEENSLAVVSFYQDSLFLIRMDESIADKIEASQTYVFTIDERFYVVPSHYIIDGRVSTEILRTPYAEVIDYRIAEEHELGMASLCDLSYEIVE